MKLLDRIKAAFARFVPRRRPKLLIIPRRPLAPEAVQRIRLGFERARGRVMVLSEGLDLYQLDGGKWAPLTPTAEDVRFLGVASESRSEVARKFRIPAEKLMTVEPK